MRHHGVPIRFISATRSTTLQWEPRWTQMNCQIAWPNQWWSFLRMHSWCRSTRTPNPVACTLYSVETCSVEMHVEMKCHQGTLLALPSMESSPAGQPARSNSIGVSQICVESGRVLSHISKTAAVCILLKQTCNRQSETGTFTVSSVCLEECLADEKCFESGDECSYQGLVKHPFFKEQAISAKGWIPKFSKDVAYNIHKYLHMTDSTERSFRQRNYSQQ